MTSRPEAIEVIRRYGAEHPDSFGEIRWDRDHYVVSFTEPADLHRDRLQALVGDPSLVEVRPTRYTAAYLEEIQRAVRARFGGDRRRILQQSGRGRLTLRAPFEPIAAELHGRYGDALDITLGAKPYPPERITHPVEVPVPASTVELADLEVDFHLGATTVTAGEDLSGSAVLTNRGSERLRFLTGASMYGGVRRPGESRMAGGLQGAVAPVGRHIDLEPGASADTGVVVGTASYLPDRTYVVPAGEYEVVARLSVSRPGGTGPHEASPCGEMVVIGPRITVVGTAP